MSASKKSNKRLSTILPTIYPHPHPLSSIISMHYDAQLSTHINVHRSHNSPIITLTWQEQWKWISKIKTFCCLHVQEQLSQEKELTNHPALSFICTQIVHPRRRKIWTSGACSFSFVVRVQNSKLKG